MLFYHLATLQGWYEAKKLEIHLMYLQDVAFDYLFQFQLQNQLCSIEDKNYNPKSTKDTSIQDGNGNLPGSRGRRRAYKHLFY